MTYIEIRYSTDGGHNWTDWRKIPLGETGDFQHRVVSRRFGTGRRYVFDIRCTDPVPCDLLAASVEMEPVR